MRVLENIYVRIALVMFAVGFLGFVALQAAGARFSRPAAIRAKHSRPLPRLSCEPGSNAVELDGKRRDWSFCKDI